MSSPAPLLQFFQRGEVAKDVRLLAAQGVLAPRAHEQISILILLTDDRDLEVRATAEKTLDSIPEEALRSFLARSDVPVGVREYFGNKGIFPSEIPAITADTPLIEVGEDDDLPHDESLLARIQQMGFSERIKAAMRGSREIRAILIRDPNKMVAQAALSSPKVTESEIESFAKMATVSEDVLRTIGTTRVWLRNYAVVVALSNNPKTPLGLSLNLMHRLTDRDLGYLSMNRNVPDPLRQAARRKVVFGTERG